MYNLTVKKKKKISAITSKYRLHLLLDRAPQYFVEDPVSILKIGENPQAVEIILKGVDPKGVRLHPAGSVPHHLSAVR